MKYKIAEEVALQDFERMCQAHRVDTDESELSEEEKEDFHDKRAKIVKAIRLGSLVVAESGLPTYTPRDGGEPMTFYPATGATMMALESHGKGKDIANLMAALTEMTRSAKGTFSKLSARDFTFCSQLAALFFTSE
jgi:hypothetical protein